MNGVKHRHTNREEGRVSIAAYRSDRSKETTVREVGSWSGNGVLHERKKSNVHANTEY